MLANNVPKSSNNIKTSVAKQFLFCVCVEKSSNSFPQFSHNLMANIHGLKYVMFEALQKDKSDNLPQKAMSPKHIFKKFFIFVIWSTEMLDFHCT